MDDLNVRRPLHEVQCDRWLPDDIKLREGLDPVEVARSRLRGQQSVIRPRSKNGVIVPISGSLLHQVWGLYADGTVQWCAGDVWVSSEGDWSPLKLALRAPDDDGFLCWLIWPASDQWISVQYPHLTTESGEMRTRREAGDD